MFASNISAELTEKAAAVKLLCLDVDGVFTDGQLYFSAEGESLKGFSTLDGLGVKLIQKAGIDVAIITGRKSDMVAIRAKNLGIKHVIQGRDDKLQAATELAGELGISFDAIGHVGDDLPDLALIRRAVLGVTVPNGHPFVAENADYCTQSRGGSGAVREVCELLLHARGLLDTTLADYL